MGRHHAVRMPLLAASDVSSSDWRQNCSDWRQQQCHWRQQKWLTAEVVNDVNSSVTDVSRSDWRQYVNYVSILRQCELLQYMWLTYVSSDWCQQQWMTSAKAVTAGRHQQWLVSAAVNDVISIGGQSWCHYRWRQSMLMTSFTAADTLKVTV